MGVDTTNGHEAMDYPEHVRSYSGFVRVTIRSTAALLILLAGMAIFLT